MQIDGEDFTGLTLEQAALKLYHMKGADMLWYVGVFGLVVAALMASALPLLLVVLLQYPFLIMLQSNIDAAHDRRCAEFWVLYAKSFCVKYGEVA